MTSFLAMTTRQYLCPSLPVLSGRCFRGSNWIYVEINETFTKKPLPVLFAYKTEVNQLDNINRLEEKTFDIVFYADG